MTARCVTAMFPRCIRGIAFLLVALASLPATAATITVDTFAQVDATKCTLTNAIKSANDDVDVAGCVRAGGIGADTIVLPFGTYALTVPDNGTGVELNGLPVVTTDVTIRGNGSTITRTNGTAPPFFRIFSVEAGTLTLVELTVSGGRITGTEALPEDLVTGGGIEVSAGGSLTLSSATVRDNHLGPHLTRAAGGGIGARISSAITLVDSILADNSATGLPDFVQGSMGGGLAVLADPTGAVTASPEIGIVRSHIRNNVVTARRVVSEGGVRGLASGGGVATDTGRLTLTSSVVAGNTATSDGVAGGGGIALLSSQVSTKSLPLTISDCTFTDNAARADRFARGGAILVMGPDEGSVQRSAFVDNSARAEGDTTGPNQGRLASGGAIQALFTNLTISDVTLVGNSAVARQVGGLGATALGGAILVDLAALTLRNVTMTGNSIEAGTPGTSSGAGVVSNGPVTLQNSIVIGNSGPSNCAADLQGAFVSLGNNINPASGSCGDPVASDKPGVDPQLGALIDLGRAAGQYLPISATSPAIDSGNPAACAPVDQLGQSRAGTCDIGAAERVPATTSVAAILPSTRAGQLGTTLTAFVTVINSGAATAFKVGLALLTPVPAVFAYQTTDAQNAPVGPANTAVDIPAGVAQTFVISVLPTGAFPPTDLVVGFTGTNTSAPSVVGLNTLLVSASVTPVPDLVALVATLGNDGIVDIPAGTHTGIFTLATVNLGASDTITVTTDTAGAVVPLTVRMCRTDSAGACLQPPVPNLTFPIAAGATPTLGFFVTSTETIPFNPSGTRLFVRLTDSTGAIRGGSSVAPRTVP